MQVKFETDYLYLLFTDSFFQDKQIGAKVTAAYRIVVNYLLSVPTAYPIFIRLNF
ncbi:unnamed protein product [Neisseria lactamica Y92-1009]|nr:unnamed protein product [Neisseria lactamica Y92-1009]